MQRTRSRSSRWASSLVLLILAVATACEDGVTGVVEPPPVVVDPVLTPYSEELAGRTYEQFVRAMREGVWPDGAPLQEPMTFVAPYAQNMTDAELQALWAWVQSVPAVPSTSE